MKSFKHFLGEMFNPNDKKLITALEKWLMQSNDRWAKTIEKFKIPAMFRGNNKDMVLYRGMIISDDNTESVTLNNYTSWSKDPKVAISFISDKSKQVNRKKGTKVLFREKIKSSDVVLDVDSYAQFMGFKDGLIDAGMDDLMAENAATEQEVIVKPITISKYKKI